MSTLLPDLARNKDEDQFLEISILKVVVFLFSAQTKELKELSNNFLDLNQTKREDLFHIFGHLLVESAYFTVSTVVTVILPLIVGLSKQH